jgi:hypothetical protein
MSLSDPLVSIVISYADRPSSLGRVLKAYEMQPYQNLEVILVHDGLSPIGELQSVTTGHDVRCYGIDYKHGYGRRALCRNIGAARAQGEILVFNDVDVIPETGSITRIVKTLLENRELGVCGRIWEIEGGVDRAIKSVGTGKVEDLKAVSKPMEYDPSLPWSTVGSIRTSKHWWSFISTFCAFRRRDFFFLLGWDPRYSGWGYEDTDLGYRILTHGMSVAFFDDIVGYHIGHPEEKLKNVMALRNLSYFTQKFPELKSFPVLVKRQAELEKLIAGLKIVPDDPLRTNSHHLEFRRFLEHPVLYTRTYRKRGRREGPVSVVIPARNRAQYLEEAVLSSVHQTRPPGEVYVVVDPSEDGTEVVAEKLSRRFGEVRCIFNGKRRGVAESRNQGIVAAASDYVMFLDSDDVLNPRYFEKVAALLDQNPEVGIAYSDYVEFGEQNRVVKLPAFNPKQLLVDCIIMGPAMARRSALEQAGGYDAEQVFEDWEFWIRVIEKGWSAQGVSEPLYNYRVHQGNRDKESNKKRKEGEDLIYQKHIKLYEHYGIQRTADGRWVNAPAYRPFR